MTHRHHQQRSSQSWGQAWPQTLAQQVTQQVSQQVNKGNLRVGDTERDEAARALGDHFAAGRLDREEYDERLEAAFAARTAGELAALFRDLPQPRAAYSRPQRAVDHHAGHGFRMPFLPVLLILIGAAILFDAGWIVWVGLGVLFLGKKFQWQRQRARRHAAAGFR